MERRQRFPHRERCGMLNLLHPFPCPSLPPFFAPRSFLSFFVMVFLQSPPSPSLVIHSLAYPLGPFLTLHYRLSSPRSVSTSLLFTSLPHLSLHRSSILCRSVIKPASQSLVLRLLFLPFLSVALPRKTLPRYSIPTSPSPLILRPSLSSPLL